METKDITPFRRVLLKLEFEGSAFFGWQLQNEDPKHPPEKTTVQFAVEQALARYWARVGERYPVVGCGRTDSGVHAWQYYCHFDFYPQRHQRDLDLAKLKLGLNGILPDGVSVLAVGEVDSSFHAQKSVLKKNYVYRLLLRKSPSPLERGRVWWLPYELEGDRWQHALFLQLLGLIEGEHDFINFAAADGSAKTSNRYIHHLKIEELAVENGCLLELEFCGSGFLKQMIRNLLGTLVDCALGKLPEERLGQLLNPGDYPQLTRRDAGWCAPAEGLFLKELDYGSKLIVE